MHPTSPRPIPHRPSRAARSLATALGLVAVATGSLVATRPAAAAPERRPLLVTTRWCDPSACYLSWRVVDSDGDGVSDADELVAGTDPHDAGRTPELRQLADLLGEQALPSFEAGRGGLVVLPPELQAMVAKETGESALHTAFPLGTERRSSLARAGISVDLLAEHGISLERDGFSLGLEPAPKDGGPPARRVGGVDIGTISADGGVDGGAAEEELEPIPKLVPVHTEPYPGGTAEVYANKDVRFVNGDGRIITVQPDGGTTLTGPWKPTQYVDGEAATPTAPTEEQRTAWARMQGATTRTVEGWSTPGDIDPEVLEHRPGVLILVDPDHLADPGLAASGPRITTAQPEGVRDLPDPTAPAPGGPDLGGCERGC